MYFKRYIQTETVSEWYFIPDKKKQKTKTGQPQKVFV